MTDETRMCPVCGCGSGVIPSTAMALTVLECEACGSRLRFEYERDESGCVEYWLSAWSDEDERNKTRPDDGFLNVLNCQAPSSAKIVWGKK